MNEFTASNGLTVRREKNTWILAIDENMAIPEVYIEAAVEFLEHEKNHKPWHDAKPEEVWVLTILGQDVVAYVSPDAPLDFRFMGPTIYAGNTGLSIDHERIETARRIWPQEGE